MILRYDPRLAHGRPSRGSGQFLYFFFFFKSEMVYLVLGYFCAIVLFYLRCHHIIGGCKIMFYTLS
jgi:hypothetical protein